eukprot:4376519-Pyramimonas_sp.AAC.1
MIGAAPRSTYAAPAPAPTQHYASTSFLCTIFRALRAAWHPLKSQVLDQLSYIPHAARGKTSLSVIADEVSRFAV